ncbi:MAG: hypothetical protein H7334_01115 [Ferruginibacter sp.]|nr:hypothetical protein [Ferruginibacter sp.]
MAIITTKTIVPAVDAYRNGSSVTTIVARRKCSWPKITTIGWPVAAIRWPKVIAATITRPKVIGGNITWPEVIGGNITWPEVIGGNITWPEVIAAVISRAKIIGTATATCISTS